MPIYHEAPEHEPLNLYMYMGLYMFSKCGVPQILKIFQPLFKSRTWMYEALQNLFKSRTRMY